MLSQKLISLLKEFSGHELNKFQKFLNATYNNENQDLARFYKIIFCLLKKGKREDLSVEKQFNKKDVWKKLFSNREFNDLYLRRLSSDLTHIAYQFILVENYKNQKLDHQIELLEFFNKAKLDKHFNGTLRKYKHFIGEREHRDDVYHYQQFRAEKLIQKHLERPGTPFKDLSNLEQADYHLDCYYLIKKLKNYCDAIGYESIISVKADLHIPAHFMADLEDSPYLEEPLINAYYYVANMLLAPEKENYFFELKSLLKSNSASFQPQELKTLFIHLNNYCIIHKLSKGKPHFIEEIFDQYKFMLQLNLLLKNQIIPPQDFKNIITVGLQVEAYDWVENFIQKYTPLLPKANQENALAYNLAKVYFKQKSYHKVIEQLREVAYSSHIYALGCKQILLKTYYELDEFLPMDSLIESFRTYLRRQKLITKERRTEYLNLLKFLRKLSKIDLRDKQKMAALKEEIKSCSIVASKAWLLEKIEENR